MFDFMALGRGERVADLGAGAGYSVDRMRKAVGPSGMVYVRHEPRPLSVLPSDAGGDRRAPPLPANVTRLDTPLDSPLPPALTSLDHVTFLFGYHELVAARKDRSRFNAAVFRALKRGGQYIIAEHAAAGGAGASVSKGSERVDARLLRAEVEAAGFVFVEAADFVSSTPSGAAAAPATQYLLRFRKPR